METQKQKAQDHSSSENKARRFFILCVVMVSLFTIATELALMYDEMMYMMVVQRALILTLITYFIGNSFTLKSTLIDKAKKEVAVTSISYRQLAEKIERKVTEEKLYMQEGLTIGQLSTRLNEHEYKVRQAIIQDLSYRNFTDFINSLRIQEASDLLADRTKIDTSVLEIAYQIGFSSIGPFNRAFKSLTGMTPTKFRKLHFNSEITPSVALNSR
ncbi:MAG: helix-turn-helix domain-containing protein [Bacteroidota bacterium]